MIPTLNNKSFENISSLYIIMKNHFIFCYLGNKRNESQYFLKHVNFDNVSNIIEPFCGSSAISFAIWLEHKDKFNYYLNDSDEKLIEVYNLSKEERQECGMEGHKWATNDEAGFTAKHQAQRFITYTDKLFETWKPREKYELINANEFKKPVLNHKLIY
jgi:site-specific DNA-adenine methylase